MFIHLTQKKLHGTTAHSLIHRMAFDWGVGAVHSVWMAAVTQVWVFSDDFFFRWGRWSGGVMREIHLFFYFSNCTVTVLNEQLGGDRMFKCWAIDLNGMMQGIISWVSHQITGAFNIYTHHKKDCTISLCLYLYDNNVFFDVQWL